MTTIATDGRTMAGDGLVTGNGIKHMQSNIKVHKLPCGTLVGLSGCTYVQQEALEFVAGDRDTLDAGDDFEALILYPDGTCEAMDGKGRRYQQSVPAVTGSGGAIALGAMAAGATPREAVEIATRYDTTTGGEIIELAVGVGELKAA